MNIKQVHILFIIVATLLTGLFAGWAFTHENYKAYGAVSAVLFFALIIYGWNFNQKARKL